MKCYFLSIHPEDLFGKVFATQTGPNEGHWEFCNKGTRTTSMID